MSKTRTDQRNFQEIMDSLDNELRAIIRPSNENFLRTHAPHIPEVVLRSYSRVRRLSPAKLMDLYAALVFELALCESRLGHYRDPEILAICINLVLQRRLDDITQHSKQPRYRDIVKPAAPTRFVRRPTSAAPKKPKFRQIRRVA